MCLFLLVTALGAGLFGCSGGEISNADQNAKEKALDKIVQTSPDADKVEK